jgi:flagellar basal body rod protein FlgC
MEWDILRTAASGMDAQRITLDVAARNVAAAEASGTEAFTRLVPRFTMQEDTDEDEGTGGLRYLGTQTQHTAGSDAVAEMVAVLNAQRAYEANASVFEDAKRLMERTIDLGRM